MLLILAGLGLSTSVLAAYNATATGTVGMIQQMSTSLEYSPETTVFRISNQPTVPGATFQRFIISPAAVTDAQTRKNLVAMVLTAKATGSKLTVAYDATGGFLDQGMVAVYYIYMD